MLDREEQKSLAAIIAIANAEADKNVKWAENFTIGTIQWLATKLKEVDDELQIQSFQRLLDDKLE